MIFSEQLLLSDQQGITATAASTNTIDMGATGTIVGHSAPIERDVGQGRPIPFLVQVTEDFNNVTSLELQLQTDDNETFSSATTVVSETIPLTGLKAGEQMAISVLPRKLERYVRMNYVVVGSAPSTGKVTAGVAMSVQGA